MNDHRVDPARGRCEYLDCLAEMVDGLVEMIHAVGYRYEGREGEHEHRGRAHHELRFGADPVQWQLSLGHQVEAWMDCLGEGHGRLTADESEGKAGAPVERSTSMDPNGSDWEDGSNEQRIRSDHRDERDLVSLAAQMVRAIHCLVVRDYEYRLSNWALDGKPQGPALASAAHD